MPFENGEWVDQYEPDPEEKVVPEPVVVPPVEQQLPPVDPRIAQMQADLQEQRRLTQQLQQNMPKQPTPQNNLDDLNRQFFKDPVTSAVAIARQAAAELQQSQGANAHETLVGVAQDQARKTNPELWDKYHTEIVEKVKAQVDSQFHTNSTVWSSALDMAIGRHINDIRDAVRAEKPQAPAIKISEGGPAIGGGRPAAAPTGAAEKLTAEERQMAKDLDISPESYAAGKDAYDNQSAKGKSSWDDYVTFSSKDSRRKARAAKRAVAAK